MLEVMLQEDEYHAILLKEKIQEYGYPVESVQTNDPKDVAKYKYPLLSGKKFVIVETESRDVSLALRGANEEGYYIVQRVPNFRIAHPESDRFPYLRTYEDRKEFFEERLEKTSLKFSTIEVKDTLIRNLIRSPESYRQVSTLEDSLPEGEKVLIHHLEDTFGEIDFYNLTRVLVEVVIGQYKRNTVQQMQYFTDYKEYSPRWLGDKLIETAVWLDYFYRINNRGIMSLPRRWDELKERFDAVGIKMPREELSLSEQNIYLRKVRDYEYKEVRDNINLVIKRGKIRSEVDLYQRIVELRSD